jgi:hypothetical protein
LVLFVADLFHPVGALAVERFLNGDVAYYSLVDSRAISNGFYPGSLYSFSGLFKISGL